MLERYRGTLCRVQSNLRAQVTSYMVEHGLVRGDVPGDSFYEVLVQARLMQADLVLCALRLNTDQSLRLAEKLVGKRITRCPPCLRSGRSPSIGATKPSGDDRIVTAVSDPRIVSKRRILPRSPMYDRIARARVGMSVASLIGRGLRRRDLRIATKRGYIVLGCCKRNAG